MSLNDLPLSTQAQQVGLITEAHSYLITQLDLHTIDLEDFKFGKTKITAFSLVDNTTAEHQLLMQDWKRDFPKSYTGHISVWHLCRYISQI